MFLKKRLIFLIVVMAIVRVQGQEIKFGKVTKAELSEELYPSDESANAAYLYKSRKTYFEYLNGEGFQLVNEIHERIKIYNKEGFDYATKKINLYKSGSDLEKVTNLKAITYNLIGGKIEETKLKKEGEFEVELSKYYNQKSFTMPDIKEGSVIEYKYKMRSPFISNVDEFVFQHDVPAKLIIASLEAPEYFNFRVNMRGYLNITPVKSKKRRKIEIKNRVEAEQGLGRSGSHGVSTFRTSTLDFTSEVDTYNLTDVPALIEEPFVNNMDNYRSSAKYELAFTQFPHSTLKHYSTTWEDVVKKIYENPNFGTELKKTNYFDDDIDNLISSISDPLKRTALIFDFVKRKVKWNGYHSKYTSDGVRKAYKDRVGNVAEINLMLTAMLRYAGLKANPVLVSTRNHGIPIFPTREGYNYVISGVKIGNDLILLDATNAYGAPNLLPIRALNWQGRLILKDGTSTMVDLMPKTKALDVIMLDVTLNNDGSINGKFRQQYKSHNAMLFRKKYNKDTEEVFLENEEKKHDGIEISNYEVKNNAELNKPIVQSYELLKDNAIEVIGDKMYFSPFHHLVTSESPFKSEKREFPVDFSFPWEDKYIIGTKIPQGYKVDFLPESKIVSLPDNLGIFKYTIKSNAGTINLNSSVAFNSSIIAPQYYDTLKEFYRQLVEKQTEKVVLSKITSNGDKDNATGGR